MTKNNIAIVDYGMGNLLSVRRAFEKYSSNVIITSDPSTIFLANKLVLPGVGAFGKAMHELKKKKLVEVLLDFVNLNKPLLGICLGMQLLFEKSYEYGVHDGLGIIQGNVVPILDKANINENIKVPHIGWNILNFEEKIESNCINYDYFLDKKKYVYFVHSYIAIPKTKSFLIAHTIYGKKKIPAIVGKDNVIGCQFHPEKSGEIGLEIIRSFCEN